jgi:hypothetical protein
MRLLVVLGCIFLAVVGIVGIGIGYVADRGGDLDRESKAYVDAAIPAIVDGWNEYALKERASPEFQRASNDTDLYRLFKTLEQRLGKLDNIMVLKDRASCQ